MRRRAGYIVAVIPGGVVAGAARLGLDPIQPRPNLRPAAVISQMRPAMYQGLGADEEIRQHGFLLRLGRTVLAECHPSPPSRISIERHPAEDRKLLVHVLSRPRAAR